MRVYTNLDVERLERRSTHVYTDIDLNRPAGMDWGSNLYANQERGVCIVHESAEYVNC